MTAALRAPEVEWATESEVAERQERAYAAAMAKFMRGEWTTDSWDCEQVDAVLEAVRVAVSGISLTPTERWRIIERAALRVGGQIAEYKAGEIL